jgi:hypothetical protein
MVHKLTACLRENTWLLMAAFAAFVASSVVGALTVDAESTTPAIWLATMWVMLLIGAIIIIAVVIECLQALMDSRDE